LLRRERSEREERRKEMEDSTAKKEERRKPSEESRTKSREHDA
jgi:hypothetical protein